MTVNILIQIDKLVQLLESPVFTCTCSCALVYAVILVCRGERRTDLPRFTIAIIGT